MRLHKLGVDEELIDQIRLVGALEAEPAVCSSLMEEQTESAGRAAGRPIPDAQNIACKSTQRSAGIPGSPDKETAIFSCQRPGGGNSFAGATSIKTSTDYTKPGTTPDNIKSQDHLTAIPVTRRQVGPCLGTLRVRVGKRRASFS